MLGYCSEVVSGYYVLFPFFKTSIIKKRNTNLCCVTTFTMFYSYFSQTSHNNLFLPNMSNYGKQVTSNDILFILFFNKISKTRDF